MIVPIAPRWHASRDAAPSQMAQTEDSVSRAHDVDNAGAWATSLRHIQERTRSVLGGIPTRSVRNDHQIRLTTDRANAPRWHASRDAAPSQMAQTEDSVSRAHDVDNAGAWATSLRHIQERTRSVLGGIPTQSVGTIIKSASPLIVPMLSVGMPPVTLRVTNGTD